MQGLPDSNCFDGRYQLHEVLARGGARRVWRAVDSLLERPVVIKGMYTNDPAEVIAEFLRLCHHPHPRLPRAFDLGSVVAPELDRTSMPFHYFSQEWICGQPLKACLDSTSPEKLEVFTQEALELVAFLHHQGLTRLDLKSEHFLFTQTFWRLIDLDQARQDNHLGSIDLHGTLACLAPEVIAGGAGGPHSDLFSLGSLLAEVMRGAPLPLEGTTLEQLHHFVLHRAPPTFSDAWCEAAPKLVTLVKALLAPSPADRPLSAERALEMLDSSRRWQCSAPLPEGRLMGRAKELSELQSLEASALSAGGGGLVLAAPTRGGLTRFLSECVADWQCLGKRVLLLESLELPSHLSLEQLLLSFLRSISGSDEELARPFPTSVTAPAAEARDAQRIETLSALRQAAGRIFAQQQTLIPVVIDDVERLNASARALLEHLVPLLPGSGLLLVLGSHLQIMPESSWMQLSRLHLEPFTLREVRAHAEEVLGPGLLTEPELERVARTCEGRPGWMREALLRRWRAPESTWEGWSPADAVCLAHTTLATLSPDGARLAQTLSVLEHPVTHSLLPELSEVIDLRHSLAELVQCGLLAEQLDSVLNESTFRFQQETMRLGIMASLEPAQRQILHLRSAEVLERQSMVDLALPASWVAHHFVHAEQVSRALPYVQRSIADARAALRFEEAADWLGLLIQHTPAKASHLPELQRQLGEVLLEADQAERSKEALQLALAVPEKLPRARRALASGSLGRACLLLGERAQAREHLEAALTLAEAHALTAEIRITWWHQLAWVLLEMRCLLEAEQALQAARHAGLSLGTRLEVDQLHLEASCTLRQNQATESLMERLEAGLELSHRLKYRTGELKLQNCLVQAARLLDKPIRVAQGLEHLIDLASAAYDLPREATARHNLGNWLHSQGQSGPALEQFERAAQLYRRLGNAQRELANWLECAGLLIEHQRLDRAEVALERVRNLLEANPESSPLTRLVHQLLTCRLQVSRGVSDGQELILEALEQRFEMAQEPRLALETRADRMRIALHQGRLRDVLRLYTALIDQVPNTDTGLIWERIHGAAMTAHRLMIPHLPVGPAWTEDPQLSGRTEAEAEPVDCIGQAKSGQRQAPDPREGGDTPALREAGEASEDSIDLFAGWLDDLRKLLEVAGEEEALAVEVAATVGRMLHGRGLVFLFEGSRPMVARSHRLESFEIDDISGTILEWVREHRTSYRCADVLTDRTLGQLRSLRDARVRSVLCQPILRENACVGAVYVDHQEAGRVSSPQTSKLVSRLAALVSDLLGTTLRRRQTTLIEDVQFGLVGNSPVMQRLKVQLRQLAESTDPDRVVLLLGETGTGKSVIARSLHEQGFRRNGPFVPVNSAAIPDSLFESLMFGHARGVFTGAVTAQPGWFELARGGTLFLDEIGEMPLLQQPRLLETLGGHRQFRRLGDSRDQALDLHLVCATHRDLKAEVKAGHFRADLLRRIQVNSVRIPSLRERGPEDILLVATHLLNTRNAHQIPTETQPAPLRIEDCFTRPALEFLLRYEWPWNVGELENMFRHEGLRVQLRTGGREKVDLDLVQEALSLGGELRHALPRGHAPALALATRYKALELWCEHQKAGHIRRVYESCGGKIAAAARQLGCSRDVVYKYLGMLEGKE